MVPVPGPIRLVPVIFLLGALTFSFRPFFVFGVLQVFVMASFFESEQTFEQRVNAIGTTCRGRRTPPSLSRRW